MIDNPATRQAVGDPTYDERNQYSLSRLAFSPAKKSSKFKDATTNSFKPKVSKSTGHKICEFADSEFRSVQAPSMLAH
jgi:hypothetical protein